MADDENGGQVQADNGPENDVEANHGLPSKAQKNGQTKPQKEMGAQETGVEEPHFVELLALGFERSGDDVLQTVVAHQMAHERCDDGPEDVGLEVLLEESTHGSAGQVFLLGEGEWPRVDVGVLLKHVWMGVVLYVVFFPPVVHGQPREQRESKRSKRDVACFGFACGRVNALVADHGNGGRDQSSQWEEKETVLQRQENVCGVQNTNNGHQSDEFCPRFCGGFVQKPLVLEFFA